MKQSIVILGAGGHAVSVADVVIASGAVISCFVDPQYGGRTLLDYPIYGAVEEVPKLSSMLFAAGVGDNAVRERIWTSMAVAYGLEKFPSFIHSSAYVSPFAQVGPGSVVMAKAAVGPKTKIGNFCIVNTSASLDHDNVLDDFSSLGPGGVTGGGVKLGRRAIVSIGAVVKQNVSIGDDVLVGAHSYVHTSIDQPCVAYGSPARFVRVRKMGDAYLR